MAVQNRRVVLRARGGPENLQIIQEPLPEPGPEEVRVRVIHAGVAFGDIMWQTGKVPGSPKPPYTPGYDVLGVVDAVGGSASRFHVEDRVAALTGRGGYSQYVCLPERELVEVPESVGSTEAACVTLNYLSAWQLLKRVARLERGQRVLVHGAGGGVGTALLDVARDEGITAFGTASAGKHALVRSLGGTPIDYRHEDFVERIHQDANPGVDLVIDHVGGAEHLGRSLRCLRDGGTLVVTSSYASARGDTSPVSAALGLLRIPLWNALPNRRRAVLYDVVQYTAKHSGILHSDLTLLLERLAQGRLQPIVAARFPLESAREAQELILRERPQGKVLLDVAGEGEP